MVEPVDVVLPPKRSYYVIFNARSGTAASSGLSAGTLRAELELAGHTAWVDADEGVALEERIAAAVASDCDVVVAAGGDGTASALGERSRLALCPNARS